MTISHARELLESWWNEDPEMRYTEISCGELRRVRVSLYQIDVTGEEARRVGMSEAGTLEAAIEAAVGRAKQT